MNNLAVRTFRHPMRQTRRLPYNESVFAGKFAPYAVYGDLPTSRYSSARVSEWAHIPSRSVPATSTHLSPCVRKEEQVGKIGPSIAVEIARARRCLRKRQLCDTHPQARPRRVRWSSPCASTPRNRRLISETSRSRWPRHGLTCTVRPTSW